MLAGGGIVAPPRGGAVSPLEALVGTGGHRGRGTGALALALTLGILLVGDEERKLFRCRS